MYLGILMVLGLIMFGTWILITTAREKARRSSCMGHLYQIGLGISLYRLDHNEQYPPRLGSWVTNYIDCPKLYICPSSGHKAGSMSNVTEWTDYVFINNLPSNAPPETIIAYCRPENHKNKGGNVLFVDGHVEWFTMAMYANAVKQGRVT